MASADDSWDLKDDDLAAGEWFTWNRETADARPDLAEAVSGFEGHGSNSSAAGEASAWFKNAAIDEGAAVTRMLVVQGHVVAFYALASGEMMLTSSRKLELMGIQGGGRVGSSHVEWIARDRRAPAGAGLLAIQHAIFVAIKYVAELQGNRALTMDPYDRDTQAMWVKQGFHKSQTEIGDGLRRLYVPLFGLYYGKLKRY